MKCEVIRDLLPLYDEKLCSAESAALVEEHLKTCAACGELLEKLPEPEIIEADEYAIKPFVKVKKKLRKRVIALIALGAALLAVLIPVGYLTVNQIFHINGGTDFQDLIYRREMREFAEMIVEGRVEEYLYRDGAPKLDREFYLEKLTAAYEKVKKYDPRVGRIRSSYFNHNGKFWRYLDLMLEFTLSDGKTHEIMILPGNYDGGGFGIADWNDPRFMILLPQLTDEKSDHEVYSAFSADDIPTDRREIYAYLNLLYLSDGGDIDVRAFEGFTGKPTADARTEDSVKMLGYLLAVRFAPTEYNKVYDGYADFMRSGYTVETTVGANRFDEERNMFYYPVVMIGSDGERTAAITIKLYYDEYGFHSPRAEDIKGVTGGSDLEKKLSHIFG